MGGCLSRQGGALNADQERAMHMLNGSVYGSKHGSKHSTKHGDPSYAAAHSGPPPPPDFGLDGNYKVISLLGEGGTGQTWLCKDTITDEQVAIKFIKRPIPKVVLPMILHEIQIQARLGSGHKNLVNAHDVVLTPKFLGIVMEFAAGGNLTNYVSDRWTSTSERGGLFLEEGEARYFFKQFLSAVEFLHENHVAHRDLKLDNIVLDDQTPPRIKLCDFGFAKDWDRDSNMLTQIGTPVYMSPQLISSAQSAGKGYDGAKADVWACGVLLFVMLLGTFPFEHSDNPDPNSSAAHAEVWLQQIKCSWRENPRIAQHATRLSADCLDLLDRVFDVEEGSRITVAGIKEHPWFDKPVPPAMQAMLDALSREQLAIDEQVDKGVYMSRKRDEALEIMVQQAGRVHDPMQDKSYRRVHLAKVQKNYSLISPRAVEVHFVEGDEDSSSTTGSASQASKEHSGLGLVPEESA